MQFKNLSLFIAAALIWGSTWLAIKFQLGVVDPLVSIFYRFLLAAIIIFVYLWISRNNLKFNLKQHLFMALQGFLLFGINYWLVYLAELHIASGLVAIMFSTIVFLNIFFGALFIKSKIRPIVVLGAVIGFIGITFVFKAEIVFFNLSSQNSVALLIALMGSIAASLGNITSAYNQMKKIPVIQSNAFGMLYGSLFMLIIALILNKPFDFDPSLSYIFSLAYLALFGSVIAFSCYLTLLGKIGADRAGYITLVIPIIAIILSSIFESLQIDLYMFIGIFLISFGIVLVLKRNQNK